MASERVQLQRSLQSRRCTINCLSADVNRTFPFSQEKKVKAWSSLENMDSPGCKASASSPGWKPKQEQDINVNVGGKVFHIPKQWAMKYPHTRIGSLATCGDLAKLFKICDDYSVSNNEFFFDRDPALFHYISHFYKSGVLWIVREMCPINFEEEIAYWGLSLKNTQRCCRIVFEERADEMKDDLKVDRELMAEIEVKFDEEVFNNMACGNLRKILWNLVENPYSSAWAKAFTVLSNIFVLCSIVALTLNTVKEFQVYHINGRTYMEWVEVATILFFIFEYLLRLAATPDVKNFLMSGLNFVDMVAVMPYFVQIVLEVFTNMNAQEDFKAMAQVSKFSHVLKVIKLLRIFRILKLARHSTGMKAFGFTLRQCYQQASCILLFIAMGIFTFSALLHSAERETEGSPISSIPYAWWWAAVSISTVGYGDVVPVTILGRFVAFGCISFGIILNGMPISFLFNKFSDYYAKLKAQEYNTLSGQRRFLLKKRLRLKMDMCFRPAEEEEDTGVRFAQSQPHERSSAI